MKTVMDMANEVWDKGIWTEAQIKRIEKFAEIVREEERNKFCSLLRQLHDSYSLQSRTTGLTKSKRGV